MRELTPRFPHVGRGGGTCVTDPAGAQAGCALHHAHLHVPDERQEEPPVLLARLKVQAALRLPRVELGMPRRLQRKQRAHQHLLRAPQHPGAKHVLCQAGRLSRAEERAHLHLLHEMVHTCQQAGAEQVASGRHGPDSANSARISTSCRGQQQSR